MPTILFERTGYAVDVDANQPVAIIDLCDEHPRAGIPFSCRAANCGTCRVEVLEGLDRCEPPSQDELDLLEIFADGPEMRLGCQMRVKPGPGRIRLRVTL